MLVSLFWFLLGAFAALFSAAVVLACMVRTAATYSKEDDCGGAEYDNDSNVR